MLYLISTPIGNLGDFTYRGCETISACDYLLCEDTRKSRILLNHYELKCPLKAFHAHNEKKLTPRVLKDLKDEMTIGLLSDAGTPTVSDPGSHLIAACVEEEIEISSVPGPSAAITALSLSGLDPSRFQFLGFLPRRPGRAKRLLAEAIDYPGTTIIYESPHRIASTLKRISELDEHCFVVVARELTKKFETFVRGPAPELASKYQAHPPKGECVILIAQKST